MPIAIRVACLALLWTASAQAAVYKWRDETGATVYSQSPPPPGVPYERVGTPPPPADAGADLEALRERLRALEEEKAAQAKDRETAEQAAERERRRREDCARLRADIDVLSSGRRVRQADDQGEYVVLGEEERLARLEQARALYEEHCRNDEPSR
ncbi:MAG: hypothetical protein KatS3mg121_0527 [Gammaproteobacteria bacterium]|nr:MAG: hypothetical protein KatS3mg121_0527 [Gammaproteobacteria bacterium]